MVVIFSLVAQTVYKILLKPTISELETKWILSKSRSKVQAHIHIYTIYTGTYPFLEGNTNALFFVTYPTVPIIPIKKNLSYITWESTNFMKFDAIFSEQKQFHRND